MNKQTNLVVVIDSIEELKNVLHVTRKNEKLYLDLIKEKDWSIAGVKKALSTENISDSDFVYLCEYNITNDKVVDILKEYGDIFGKAPTKKTLYKGIKVGKLWNDIKNSK